MEEPELRDCEMKIVVQCKSSSTILSLKIGSIAFSVEFRRKYWRPET
jgi:hypothetical protein